MRLSPLYQNTYFSVLPTSKRLDWYNRAYQHHLANTAPQDLNTDELGACIWYGEMILAQATQSPPTSFEALQAFMEVHVWLIGLKHEWINREAAKGKVSRTFLRT